MKWQVIKAMPKLLGKAMEDLTNEEFLWFRIQIAIDEGYATCGECGRMGYGPYCSHCGKSLTAFPEQIGHCRTCAATGRMVAVDGRYCNLCGTPTEETEFWEQLRLGELRYDALNEMSRGMPDRAYTEPMIEILENWMGEPFKVKSDG